MRMNRVLCVAAAALLPLVGCSSSEPRAATPAADPEPIEPVAAVEPSEPAEPVEPAQPEGEGHPGEMHAHDGPANQAPLRLAADGARIFGSEMDAARATTPLRDIITRPARFAGQVVKTEGQISQVCQNRGCWLELRAEGAGNAVRVPMAGHSFFLPRDVAGHRATVLGTVAVQQLEADMREHLRSEGAQAADEALSIEATAVVVHP